MLAILGQLFLLVVAVLSTLAAWGLFVVGKKAHWSSDGPAMLFIVLALGFFVLIAYAAWSALLGRWFGKKR